MPKQKKGIDQTGKTDSQDVLPVPVEEILLPISSTISKAKLDHQEKRHNTVNYLFDKAAEVLGSYLDDPTADISAKMFPAKLAADIYTAQEKFKREDERIEIEKRKLTLEEIKLSQTPIKATFNQQNNFISPATPIDLAELKKKQETLLASFIPKKPDEPEN